MYKLFYSPEGLRKLFILAIIVLLPLIFFYDVVTVTMASAIDFLVYLAPVFAIGLAALAIIKFAHRNGANKQ